MDDNKRLFLKTAFASVLAGAGGLLLTGPAFASEDPIPGVDVVVEKVPPGNGIARVTTGPRGEISFRSLEAGAYRVRGRGGETSTLIRHRGGPARWRLVNTARDSRRPTWSLADASDPL